jgi:hypothetical protein
VSPKLILAERLVFIQVFDFFTIRANSGNRFCSKFVDINSKITIELEKKEKPKTRKKGKKERKYWYFFEIF